MIFGYICIVIFCGFLVILLGWRYQREYMVRKVAQQIELDALGKRKLLLFKNKLREEHLWILLVASGIIALTVFLLTLLQFSLGRQLRNLTDENKQIKEEIIDIGTAYGELIQMPLFSYPSNGISFDAIDWEHLLVMNNNEERFVAEQELSYQLSPFLGRTMILIFPDQPMQEISLTLASTLVMEDDLIFWEENWHRVLEDMAKVAQITQITCSVQFTEDKEGAFEQTAIREGEHWDILARRYFIQNNGEDIREEHAADFTETEEAIEQKGSVEIDK